MTAEAYAYAAASPGQLPIRTPSGPSGPGPVFPPPPPTPPPQWQSGSEASQPPA